MQLKQNSSYIIIIHQILVCLIKSRQSFYCPLKNNLWQVFASFIPDITGYSSITPHIYHKKAHKYESLYLQHMGPSPTMESQRFKIFLGGI